MSRRQDFFDLDDRMDRVEPSTIALFLVIGLLCVMLCFTAFTGYETLQENIELKAKLAQCQK